MRRPVAIALKYQHPFAAAAESANNTLQLVLNFMYGTPERVRITMAFSLALAALGGYLYHDAMPVCAI